MFKWFSRKFYHQNFKIGDGKETSKKIKLFAWSLSIGIIASIIVLFAAGINVFESIGIAFESLGEYTSSQDRLMSKIAIFGLAGIAVAIGFKTGLFNIGVSGQMLFAGLTAGSMALIVGDAMPNVLGQIVILIIAIASAALIAAIAGAMKAFFGVHEVVTTILINWIMFFLMQAVVKDFLVDYKNSNQTATINFGENFLFTYSTPFGPMGGWIAIVILILTGIGIYLLIYKSSFGHKMIIVGQNKEAALAAGINVKTITVSSMAISGAVAGLLAIVFYFIQNQNIEIQLADAIPQQGFDGIAIAILAFSNPLATLPIAVIFGIIQGIIDNAINIDATFGPLVTGILIFTAAINTAFSRWDIKLLCLKVFWSKQKVKAYLEHQEKCNSLNEKYYEEYNQLLLTKRNQRQKIAKQNKNLNRKKQYQQIKDQFHKKLKSLIANHNKDLKKQQSTFSLIKTQGGK